MRTETRQQAAEPSQLTDAELLARFRADRSNRVFAQIVERHGPMVLHTCLRRVGNLHDAEDAAQTTFTALARHVQSISGSLGAWLHGVAQHSANHLIRARQRRTRHEEQAASMRATRATAAPDQAHEWRDEIDGALAQLPEALREAVILRFLEGRKLDEAARLAGCPLTTLARRATEGTNRLRTLLARRGMVLSATALAGLLAQEAITSAAVTSSLAALKTWALTGALHGGATTSVVSSATQAVGWAKAKVYAVTVAVAATTAGASVPFLLPSGEQPPATQVAVNPVQLGVNASLGGRRLFPADNPWNQDISAQPVDASSDALIASIGREKPLFPAFGPPYEGQPNGVHYVVVPGQQARTSLRFQEASESDAGPYPLPAPTDLPFVPRGAEFPPLIVLDRDNWQLYEVHRPAHDGHAWRAFCGATFDLNSNRLRPDGWTSADAAGLPILPGLIRWDEVAELGEIHHALRFSCSRLRGAYVAPARHCPRGPNDATLPPLGMRVRLRADFDISSFSPKIRVILIALKKYGMFLAEAGTDWYLSGTADSRWPDQELKSLQRIKGRDFEVVRLGAVQTLK